MVKGVSINKKMQMYCNQWNKCSSHLLKHFSLFLSLKLPAITATCSSLRERESHARRLWHCSRVHDVITLTLYSYEGLFTCRSSNTIISSTSVSSLVLSTDILQRHADRTVIRKSCPGDGWCRTTSCITEQSHGNGLIYCLVSRNVSDVRRNWVGRGT